MPVRASTIADHNKITSIDLYLARDQETYPHKSARYGLILAQALAGGVTYPTLQGTFTDTQTRFYTIVSKEGETAGFMVLQNWLGQDDISRQLKFSESDTRILFLGISSEFRRRGLGSEAIAFALKDAVERNPRGNVIAKIKSMNAVFMAMLDYQGFEPQTVGDQFIAHRRSSEHSIGSVRVDGR